MHNTINKHAIAIHVDRLRYLPVLLRSLVYNYRFYMYHEICLNLDKHKNAYNN